MTKHSREPCTSVTRAACSWLCRPAVNNAHKYRNQVNVSLSLLLSVPAPRRSCAEESELFVSWHRAGSPRAVPGWRCRGSAAWQGLRGIWDRCRSCLSPGPSWLSTWEVFPREICAEDSFQWGWQEQPSEELTFREYPLAWPRGLLQAAMSLPRVPAAAWAGLGDNLGKAVG